MATLISNIDELKANLGAIDANFTWETIASYVEDVERDMIEEFIGEDAVLYFQGNSDLEGVGAKVRTYLTRAEAYLTIFKWSQFALFKLTDRALIIATSKDGVIPSDKKLTDLRNTCEDGGFNFLDKAITLMEANLDSFTAYRDSGTRQTLLQGFIKTAKEFSRLRNIDDSRLTFMSMVAIMLNVQDDYLPGVMGEDYYGSFKERYLDEDLSEPEKKLLPLITKAVAFLTVAQACIDLPVKVGSKGLLINKYNDTREYAQADPAEAARVQFLSEDCKEKGDRKLNELRLYLIKYAILYPEFIPPIVITESPNSCDSGLFIM